MKTVILDGDRVTPSKILCIGRNYVAHIRELGNEIPDEMVVFGKPNSAIGDTLHAQLDGEPLHYEGEIALMIEAGRPVAAGFGLDLTKRALQSRLKSAGLPWREPKPLTAPRCSLLFVALRAILHSCHCNWKKRRRSASAVAST